MSHSESDLGSELRFSSLRFLFSPLHYKTSYLIIEPWQTIALTLNNIAALSHRKNGLWTCTLFTKTTSNAPVKCPNAEQHSVHNNISGKPQQFNTQSSTLHLSKKYVWMFMCICVWETRHLQFVIYSDIKMYGPVLKWASWCCFSGFNVRMSRDSITGVYFRKKGFPRMFLNYDT